MPWASAPEHYYLQPGYVVVAQKPMIISTVLGSCVAVAIYDRRRRAGGMNHFLFPRAGQHRPTTRWGDVATRALIRLMYKHGARRKHLVAHIIGGAAPVHAAAGDPGQDNVQTARRILRAGGVRIVSEDIGGHRGRKVVFDTRSNEATVLKVDRLRREDWFPYSNHY